MAAVPDLRALFVRDLGDILYAEQRIVEMLERLLEQTSDSELRDGFGRHLERTRDHVRRLEEAFDILDEKPRAAHSPSLEGIEVHHFKHIEELAEELVDIFNAGVAARIEHYEISVYEGLVPMGEALEEKDVVALIWENLKDEKEALQEVSTMVERLATVRGPGSAMP